MQLSKLCKQTSRVACTDVAVFHIRITLVFDIPIIGLKLMNSVSLPEGRATKCCFFFSAESKLYNMQHSNGYRLSCSLQNSCDSQTRTSDLHVYSMFFFACERLVQAGVHSVCETYKFYDINFTVNYAA